jgi:trehalose 6-phosphate synthase
VGEELLDGMLGSSILGFHTRFHCNNFVDTVDRLLEARVDREMFTVSYRGQPTAVKRYPISIEWPPSPALVGKPVEDCRRDVRQRHHLPADQAIGSGDRSLHHDRGTVARGTPAEYNRTGSQVTFIQIAAPTRTRMGNTRNTKRVARDADQ